MAVLTKRDKLLKVLGVEPGQTVYDIDIYDEHEEYHRLLAKINLDKWYYNNKKIPYTHNEYGYRCDNLSDIKDNDYGLSFGCSHTYGTGLFYEDTYSYKISNELNVKNINLGMPASGIKVQQYNTTLFVNNFASIRLPKYVIYQYPHDYRVSFSNFDFVDDKLELPQRPAEISNIGINDEEYDKLDYTQKFYLENPGEKHLQDLLVPLYLNNTWASLGVPVYHITFGNDFPQEYKSDYQDFNIQKIKRPDYGNQHLYHMARDLMHEGIEFNDKVKEIILKKIKNG